MFTAWPKPRQGADGAARLTAARLRGFTVTGRRQPVGALELVRGDHAAFAEPAISSLSSSAVQRQALAK
jgi:hypothetical protein